MSENGQNQTTYALAAAGGSLYAARAAGVYRSGDGGRSWVYACDSLGAEGSIAATALAAQGRSVFAGINGGILRSSDGGVTWFAAGLGQPPPLVAALALSPAFEEDGTLLAASAEDGIFASTDRGQNWRAWNFGLIDLNVNALAWSPDGRCVFAGTESGVFHSRNGGLAWRALPFPMELAPVISLALSPAFVADSTLYAGSEGAGLHVSRDGGASWRSLPASVAGSAANAILADEGSLALALDDRLLHSRDDGASWTELGNFPGQAIMALLSEGSGLRLALASGETPLLARDAHVGGG